MRTQVLFFIVVVIAVSGCGNSEHLPVPQDGINSASHNKLTSEVVPYRLIETADDGSQVISYFIEVLRPETRAGVNVNGIDEVHTVMKATVEERIASVPPGEDISEFLRLQSGGRIINPETYSKIVE